MKQNILTLAAHEIVDHYRQGTLSPVDVMTAVLAQVENMQPVVNAFAATVSRDDVLAAAKQSEERWQQGKPSGALDGVPVTIKDWYHIKGMPTRFGSLLSPDVLQTEDAILVAKLKEAGAIIIGKTTLPEYGHKGTTFSPLTGVTRNPWDTDLTPGGSSGGAAAAAATGMGYLHLGSDAGGSIRIPASFSGVFGFKPTPGTVAHWPPGPFSSMSSAGPLTRHVMDAALMMDIIGRDGFSKTLEQPLPQLKIAYARSINDTPVDPAIDKLFMQAVDHAKSFGAVEEITLEISHLIDTFNKHWMAVAAWALRGASASDLEKTDPRYALWAARGHALPVEDYIEAQQQRLLIAAQMKDLLSCYDILLTPTTAMTAFAADQNMPIGPDGEMWDDWTPLTYPANLAQLPAASLPSGLTPSGMPAGIQIMAGPGRDELVLQFCHALEQKIGFKDWLKRN